MVKGSIELELDDKKTTLGAGAFAMIPGGAPRAAITTSETTTRVLVAGNQRATIAIYDVSDPTAARFVGEIDVPSPVTMIHAAPAGPSRAAVETARQQRSQQ